MQLARVGVRVIVLVVGVVCLMLVLSARVVVHAVYSYSFRSQFSVAGGILFTMTGDGARADEGRPQADQNSARIDQESWLSHAVRNRSKLI